MANRPHHRHLPIWWQAMDLDAKLRLLDRWNASFEGRSCEEFELEVDKALKIAEANAQ